MSKKTFESDLSVEGINRLKQDLLQYKDVELKNKCRMLVERLTGIGLNAAETQISASPLGGNVSIRVDTKDLKNGTNAMLIASGTVVETEGREPFNIMLAIEFGSGIFYNQNVNPNAGEFGLGPGTFPGQIHAFEDGWYYWDAGSEQWRYTHGIKATMPMYEAGKRIIESVEMVAMEVFG